MIKNCEYTKRVLKERKLFLIFISLSIIAPFLSLCLDCRPENETLGSWLQRSGSVMVVLALLAEMRAYQMLDVFKPSGFVGETYSEVQEKYLPQVKLFNFLAFILIAVGTLIWGYGDLLV